MKNEFSLSIGTEVFYLNKVHIIKAHLSLTSFLLVDKTTGKEIVVKLDDISFPSNAEKNSTPLVENGLIELSDKTWKETEYRASIIRPLAEMISVPITLANEAAEKLSVSSRTIYALIRRFRESGGLLTSIAPNASPGGRGKSRLLPIVEQIISTTIDEMYLSKQKHSVEYIVQEVRRRCFRSKLPSPSFNTINDRIKKISSIESAKYRHGNKALRCQSAIKGHFPEVFAPLELIQMDHTPVDLIIVDEKTRRPIGRPYLTAAIDIYSRTITGFCLTLEAPSAVSVGLCLAHSVIDKTAYLNHLGIEGEWPTWGKPLTIYVDNAKEFHSEALRRGCAQHGIELRYRPVGQPQYGGIIERLIGTLMQLSIY
jgi:putative transposase